LPFKAFAFLITIFIFTPAAIKRFLKTEKNKAKTTHKNPETT
jgi:hypothetical protein